MSISHWLPFGGTDLSEDSSVFNSLIQLGPDHYFHVVPSGKFLSPEVR